MPLRSSSARSALGPQRLLALLLGLVLALTTLGTGAAAQTQRTDSVPAAEGTSVAGRVTDLLSGAPVVNARVWSEGVAEEATTDADGVYVLPVDEGTYTIQVEADGYLPGVATDGTVDPPTRDIVVPVEGRTGIDVQLEVQPVLRGVVLSPAMLGSEPLPLPGVVVKAFDAEADGDAAAVPVATGETGLDGQWVIDELLPGSYLVQFDAAATDSFSQWWDGAAQRADATAVEVLPGDDQRLDVTLRLGASVSGRVVDTDGEPVAGISVRAINQQSGAPDGFASTDVDGNFRITRLNAGQYTLLTRSDEYLDTYYGDATVWSQVRWFSVPESAQVTDRDIVVEMGGAITGHVTAPDGKDVTPTVVRAGGVTSWSVWVEPDGTYRAGGLESGSYTVGFHGSGLVSQWWDGAAGPDEATVIEVTAGETTAGIDAVMELGEDIQYTARLTGKVVSEGGDPLPDIVAEAECYPPGSTRVWQSTRTDVDGLFDLAVPAGSCTVGFSDPQRVFVSSSWGQWVDLGEGDHHDLGITELELGATVAGTVVRTSTGDPVDDARVELRHADAPSAWRTVTTDGSGRYEFGPLVRGVYQVRVVGSDRGMTSAWWPAATSQASAGYLVLRAGELRADVDMSVDRVASVTGAVTGEAGEAVEGVRVTLDSPAGSTSVTSDADGGFTIGGRPAGDYTLAFDGRHVGYLPEYWDDVQTEDEATPITLAPGQALSGISAALATGGTIEGAITDTEGQPVVGAQVSVPPLGWAVTDTGGRYRIPGLDAGEYTVTVYGPYDELRPFLTMYWPGVTAEEDAQKIVVSAGTTSTADLVLSEGGNISGTVSLTTVPDAQEARVWARSTDGQHGGTAAVAEDGSYTITGLADGDYVVSASYAGATVFWPGAPDAASATTVTISGFSSVDDIDLVVPEGALVSGTVGLPEGVGPATVTLWDLTLRRLGDRVVTDDGGAFAFRPEPGEYVVHAESYDGTNRLTGFYGGGSTWLDAATVQVSQVGEVVPGIDIALEGPPEGHDVEGRLLLPGGSSPDLEGLTVALRPGFINGSAFFGAISADGTFRIQDVVAGEYVVDVYAAWDVHAPVVVDGLVDVQVPSDGPLEIPVQLTGSLTGTVVTEVGSLTDAMVTVIDSAGQRHTAGAYLGTYTVGGLPAGPATVRIEPERRTGWVATYVGGDHRLTSAQPVTVRAGEVAEAPATTLPFGGVVTGTIDGDGLTTVLATSPSGEVYTATGDTYDTYRLTGVPDEDVVIEATQDGMRSTWWDRATTREGATPVRVGSGQVLEGIDLLVGDPQPVDEGVSVSGVVLRDGLPFSGVNVRLYPLLPGDERWAETQQDGSFTLAGVQPGTHRLQASACLRVSMDIPQCAWATSEPFTVAEGTPTTGIVINFGEAGEPPVEDVPFEVVPEPVISGDAVVGSTLSVSTGGWVPQPESTQVAWLADGVPVDGATDPELVVGADLVGAVLTALVTASAEGYVTTSAESDPVGPVTDQSDPDPGPVPEVVRTGGADRYATAASLVLDNYGPGLEVVYLAAGTNFPDALAGAAVAGWDDAPVLLTRVDGLPTATKGILETLQPERVVLLGGEKAIAESVAQELLGMGLTVQRVAGADRYATAAQVSALLDPADTVFVAAGLNYPDALAGAAAAGTVGAPVLLTRHGSLPEVAVDELLRHDPTQVIVLGGETAVSAAVITQIEELGYPVERIHGADRYETAAALASWWETGAAEAWVAAGSGYADALSAAPLAARQGGPILLSRYGSLPSSTGETLVGLGPDAVHLLGGEASLSAAVAQAILDLPWGG